MYVCKIKFLKRDVNTYSYLVIRLRRYFWWENGDESFQIAPNNIYFGTTVTSQNYIYKETDIWLHSRTLPVLSQLSSEIVATEISSLQLCVVFHTHAKLICPPNTQICREHANGVMRLCCIWERLTGKAENVMNWSSSNTNYFLIMKENWFGGHVVRKGEKTNSCNILVRILLGIRRFLNVGTEKRMAWHLLERQFRRCGLNSSGSGEGRGAEASEHGIKSCGSTEDGYVPRGQATRVLEEWQCSGYNTTGSFEKQVPHVVTTAIFLISVEILEVLSK